jgi:hypothetical protein
MTDNPCAENCSQRLDVASHTGRRVADWYRRVACATRRIQRRGRNIRAGVFKGISNRHWTRPLWLFLTILFGLEGQFGMD